MNFPATSASFYSQDNSKTHLNASLFRLKFLQVTFGQSWAFKKHIVKRKRKFRNQNFSSLKRKRKFRNQKFLSSKRKRKFRNQTFVGLKRKRKFRNQNF